MFKSRLRKLTKDAHLGQVFKNFGLLLSGRGVAGVLSLGTLALMGRGLAPAQFGIVVLVYTYSMALKGLVSIQPVAAVIHFGVAALQRKETDAFKRLITYTFLIDWAGGIVAALLAISLAPFAARFLHWDTTATHYAQLYCLVLFFAAEPTAKGVLRLFNRFDLLSVQGIIRPSVRVTGVAIAYFVHAPLGGYLMAWFASDLAHYVTLLLVARAETRKQVGGPLFIGFDLRRVHKECPRLWHYMLTLYWQNLLDLVQKQIATLLAGVLFGPVAAGLYKVAWDFSNVLSKPVFMLRNLILPDLARLWHQRDKAFRRLTFRSGAIAGSVSALILMVVIFAGRPLISLVMGPSYGDAAPLLSLLVLASTIDLYGFALRPAGYAMGRPGTIVSINTVAMVIYGVLFFGLSARFGLLAPGLAAAVAAFISLIALGVAIVRLSAPKNVEA